MKIGRRSNEIGTQIQGKRGRKSKENHWYMTPKQSKDDLIYESLNTRRDLGNQLNETKELYKMQENYVNSVEHAVNNYAKKASTKISFKST